MVTRQAMLLKEWKRCNNYQFAKENMKVVIKTDDQEPDQENSVYLTLSQ